MFVKRRVSEGGGGRGGGSKKERSEETQTPCAAGVAIGLLGFPDKIPPIKIPPKKKYNFF